MSGVEILRKILKAHDDGLLTEGEVGYRVLDALLSPHVERADNGQESGMGTSWCGGEPPPPKRAIVEIGATRIWFYPIAWAAPGGE